jgi:hypothetical protein
MKCASGLIFLLGLLGFASGATAQTGAIEFTARVAPTVGNAEPARKIPVYLLRKSFADIQKEADEAEPKLELDRFIDGLDVSKELKAWMKRTRVVQLQSAELTLKLAPEDIFTVPEFFDAYFSRNAGDETSGFPAPKYKESDKKSNPQRYERQVKEYREQVRRFLDANPQSLNGIELELVDIDPGRKWLRQEAERRQRVRLHALNLAETRYLVTKTQTDLNGRGGFTNVPPGEYWLSTLEVEAIAGDSRVRWDAPVTVRAGETSRIDLWNGNAVPAKSAR